MEAPEKAVTVLPIYQPKEDPVSLSKEAAEVIVAALKEKGKRALRVDVEQGPHGSAGFRLGMDEAPRDTDLVFVSEGVTIHLDRDSAELVRGTRIDHEPSEDGGRFLVGMPHRHGGCACGGSHGGQGEGGHGAGGCGCGHEQ